MSMGDIHLGGTARSPDDVVSLIRLGLDFAEIPATERSGFWSYRAAYGALRKERDIYYLCHGPREGNPNDIEALEQVYWPKLLEILPAMPDLGMKFLTIHLWLDPRFVKRKSIDYKIQFLRRLTERAHDLDIAVGLENLSERAEDLRDVFSAVPLLNLTLDLGHAQLLTQENTSSGLIESFSERIKHLHIHDNRGGDSPDDDLHLPVGEGIIDFPKIFRKLAEIDYRQSVSLELRPHEIEKCLDHVKDLLACS
jgi:sugar phosphate isomerase/epimerase